MKLHLYIATHKKVWLPRLERYSVIQLNSQKNGHEEYAEYWDDTGENISFKNDNYCELTALYWIWKNNLTDDYIGLVHYRRYFSFVKCFNPVLDRYILPADEKECIESMIRIPKGIVEIFSNYDIILPRKQYFNEGIKSQYCSAHIKEDFEVLSNTIIELYPEYKEDMIRVWNGHCQFGYNMFVTSKEIFDKYMKWLFEILFEVEKKIKISDDLYQKRVFGFMSERMMALYVFHNKLRVKTLPVIFIDDQSAHKSWKRKSINTVLADVGIKNYISN